MVTRTVNGESRDVEVPADMALLWSSFITDLLADDH